MDKQVKNPSLLPEQEAVLDTLLTLVKAAGPLAAQTDKYFTNTSSIKWMSRAAVS